MSQSTEGTPGSNPFIKPGFIIAAALVVALLAATVVIFMLPKGDNAAQPAPASSSGSASVTPTAATDGTGKSVCGLPPAMTQHWERHRRLSGNWLGRWLSPPLRRPRARGRLTRTDSVHASRTLPRAPSTRP